MIPSSTNVIEVKPGDLLQVKGMFGNKTHYYLVVKIEPSDDPNCVTYKAVHEGKIITFRKMKRYIDISDSSVVSRVDY